MKLCQTCGQLLAEDITSCPACGNPVEEGRRSIDEYRIIKVLHEGYATTLCRAVNELTGEPVMIRIFSPESGVDRAIATRLKNELEELHKLPQDYFVRHFEIRQSTDGLWYRVSEWLDAENWGSLIASGIFQDYTIAFRLFYRIAAILEGLHRIGHIIPHLILDDILVIKDGQEELKVKVDYKLSRFLDPKLDRPGPTLKNLLECHPDIIHQRPLDIRSDIWSLGKIFVELLTARHESTDFKSEVDQIILPPQISVLLKSMLADDPDLRPQSMAEVAETLSQVADRDLQAAMRRRREALQPPVQEIRSLKKRIALLALILGAATLLALLVWFFFTFKQQDTEKVLASHANRYARSVAFVLTEFRLIADDTAVYRNRSEGTAFLVDQLGYLLTNRHVACPWLEDKKFYRQIQTYRNLQRPLRLDYRVFLWFEGQKAFKPLPDVSESNQIEDIYVLSSAYRTDGRPRLVIAGVARAPDRTYQLIRSPLKDDFAVLRVEPVPAGLPPLPLDETIDPPSIPRLSPVITLGFPLGRQTQATSINVSVTQGHVRRAFENLIQVDTSIHRGNSGGPIIDIRGKVIGIASGVAMDWAIGPLPIATLLPDMGMVLPVNKAARFLQELKSGRVKWDGVLDLSVDAKIAAIMDLAQNRRWSEARKLADKELKTSLDPALVMAAAMIHYCVEDYDTAGRLFERSLSIDDENELGRLMLYLIDWVAGKGTASLHRKALLGLDWRSKNELFAYLVKVLEGNIPEEAALKGGYTELEQNWLRYVVALIAVRENLTDKAENLLQPILLTTDRKAWLHFLALAAYARNSEQKLARIDDSSTSKQYREQLDRFAQKLQTSRTALAEHRSELMRIQMKLSRNALDPGEKETLLNQLRELDPANQNVLVDLVFDSAANGNWDKALAYAGEYLALDGRENSGRLRLGLLAGEILHIMGHKRESQAALVDYQSRIMDNWYRLLAQGLVNPQEQPRLIEKAAESPEYVLTAHVALALWAEGNEDSGTAVDAYREALGSYMDDMVEYRLAAERIKRLRYDSRQ